MEFLRFKRAPALSISSLFDDLGADDLKGHLIVEESNRAKRLSLRVEPARGCIVLVRPKRASARSVVNFAAEHLGWIRKYLSDMPVRVPFTDGAQIPYRGVDHIIRGRPDLRGGVWCEDNEIIVTGRPEHTTRRITDWLKNQARDELSGFVQPMSEALDCKVSRLTVRDTRSRWGSCAHGGKLSFSWRLILAPANVLTYVAAHEVAHLRHANHGAAFKRTVAELLSPYGVDAASASQWLVRSGAGLHRYG